MRPKHRARRRHTRSLRVAAVVATLAALTPAGLTHGTSARFTDTSVLGGNTFAAAVLAPPTEVSAAPHADGGLYVNWSVSASEFADGYKVQRATDPAGPFTEVADRAGRTSTGWHDTAVAAGTSYYYRVLTYAQQWTQTSGSDPGMVLSQPAGVAGSATGTRVDLSWDPVPGADFYRVYERRCATPTCDAGEPWVRVESILAPPFTADNSAANTYYFYRVAAVDPHDYVESPVSAVVGVTTVPGWVPTDWVDPQYVWWFGIHEDLSVRADTSATSMKVERSVDGGTYAPYTTGTGADEGSRWFFNETAVTGWGPPRGGHDYKFRAQACNDAGCSPWLESATTRIPWWWDTHSIGARLGLRTSHRIYPAPGSPIDYSWVNYVGAETEFGWGECPPFRSCAGNDKSILLKNPRGGAGYLERAGTDPGNGQPVQPGAAAARTVEFFYKQYGAWQASAWLLGQPQVGGTMGTQSFGMKTGSTSTSAVLPNGTTISNLKYADGQWHLYHLTYNGTRIYVYEDGVLKGSTTDLTLNTDPAAEFRIGFARAATYGAKGWFDEFSIFDGYMSGAMIAERWAARADGD